MLPLDVAAPVPGGFLWNRAAAGNHTSQVTFWNIFGLWSSGAAGYAGCQGGQFPLPVLAPATQPASCQATLTLHPVLLVTARCLS